MGCGRDESVVGWGEKIGMLGDWDIYGIFYTWRSAGEQNRNR